MKTDKETIFFAIWYVSLPHLSAFCYGQSIKISSNSLLIAMMALAIGLAYYGGWFIDLGYYSGWFAMRWYHLISYWWRLKMKENSVDV